VNHPDLRTLRLLEEIGNAEFQPSQRDLARKLDVSLGLVNSFVKRLVQKGYFKVTTIPRNRMTYVLTPKGATEKTRLTYKYVQQSYRFYKEARQKFHDLFQQLAQDGVRRIVFYGAGDVAEIAGICLEESRIQLVAVVDDSRAGGHLLGTTIQGTDALGSMDFDKILITAARSQIEILKNTEKLGIHRKHVMVLE
jgi:DNA-binding MarR family transcriptional regulator